MSIEAETEAAAEVKAEAEATADAEARATHELTSKQWHHEQHRKNICTQGKTNHNRTGKYVFV